MTSKERAGLKTQAMKLDSIFQVGKSSLTPQMIEAVKDALRARELVKISVLKNCLDDPHEIADVLAERTGSEVVQVIGKKIVLYKKNYELEEKRKRARKREKQQKKSKNTSSGGMGKNKRQDKAFSSAKDRGKKKVSGKDAGSKNKKYTWSSGGKI